MFFYHLEIIHVNLHLCKNLLDPCAGDPCKNGGRCVGNTEEFTFTCLCFEPYRGKTCEEGGKNTCFNCTGEIS